MAKRKDDNVPAVRIFRYTLKTFQMAIYVEKEALNNITEMEDLGCATGCHS